MTDQTKIRVMFVHGIGGPEEAFYEFLSTDSLDLLRPVVDMKTWDPSSGFSRKALKENSVLRNLVSLPIRDPLFVLFLASSVIGLLKVAWVGLANWPLLWYILAIIAVPTTIYICAQRALYNMLCKCVELQKKKLAEEKPDVVFGYSMGGCVTAMLMAMGEYTGPAVLFNPAVSVLPNLCWMMPKCKAKNGVPGLTRIPEPLRKYVTVLEGTKDGMHPEKWCQEQSITLCPLQDLGHYPRQHQMQDLGAAVQQAIQDVHQNWCRRT